MTENKPQSGVADVASNLALEAALAALFSNLLQNSVDMDLGISAEDLWDLYDD